MNFMICCFNEGRYFTLLKYEEVNLRRKIIRCNGFPKAGFVYFSLLFFIGMIV